MGCHTKTKAKITVKEKETIVLTLKRNVPLAALDHDNEEMESLDTIEQVDHSN